MRRSLSRRDFLQDTALSTAALAVATNSGNAVSAAPDASLFASDWAWQPDRVWLGKHFWANPLQDWRLSNGRIECIKGAPNRNVHLLTRQLGEQPGDLTMSVQIGRVAGGPLETGKGSAGFRIGVLGPLNEYRNSAIFGQGLDAGFTCDGRLFIGNLSHSVAVDLSSDRVELRLTVEPHDEQSRIVLAAHATGGQELARVARESFASANLTGNLALVANFAIPGNAPADASKGAKKKGATAGGNAPAGEFWFADWRVSGSRVVARDEQTFGPILFNHYSLSGGVLKMTAQMPPLGAKDSQTVRLQVQREATWTTLAEETIHPEARTATFKIANWDATRDVPYRLVYSLRQANGTSTEHVWSGTIRRDPVDQDVLTVANVSCNIHEAFPNADYTAKMAKLNPDLIAFVGDQFYESTGGYGVQRAPLEAAILDYLRKWYLHGWTWRDLTRDRPSISIPDDHDVYQGNIWGESGAAQKGTQEQGGYNMPAAWVNVVHRTQTSHHPDPWDATPCQQGISVYSGPLVYGRVSFAILADRQFKSAPEGKVPPTGGRGDHVTDPNFDPKTADLPGLQLLGPDQMKHLRAWVTDWSGAEMKGVISQTIFTAMATTHGTPNGRLVADYDTNGWPQSERNAALREIRKAFAVHIAGDQHLPAVVHYGIDEHRDASVAFAGPAVNTGYPRWFEPLKPGENRAPGAPEVTGDFRDSFGHPLTVLAVANGLKNPRLKLLEKLHDKASGIGLVRFHKPKREITFECWPFLADPSQPGTQFPGWPVTVKMLDNFRGRPAAWLPQLRIHGVSQPVVTVIDESHGEVVYSLRLTQSTWQPHVFQLGTYTLQVSNPESKRIHTFTGLVARSKPAGVLNIQV
jgi:phosphodiesterase/alkaline phosphatase D-like protein